MIQFPFPVSYYLDESKFFSQKYNLKFKSFNSLSEFFLLILILLDYNNYKADRFPE